MKIENNQDLNASSLADDEIGRRKFCQSCIQGIAGLSLLSLPGIGYAMRASENTGYLSEPDKEKIRKIFMKKGSCAHLLFYMVNKDFDNNKPDEENAIDQLAGGIGERGYQCGMLWGSSMAVGAESYRRYEDKRVATAKTIQITRDLMKAFIRKTKSPDCRVITNIDLTKRFSKLKMIFSAGDCFELAEKFVPKAIDTTRDSFDDKKEDYPGQALSCASELVNKMGGSEEEAAMVAGFAGGLGLYGNGCGALSAAIWMKSLRWCRENPGKKGYSYKGVDDIIFKFEEFTRGEMTCHKICGKSFNSIDEHTQHVQDGGCDDLLNLLAIL